MYSENIRVNLEVVQPDWDMVFDYLMKHHSCDVKIWFHSVPQCSGEFKLFIQLYCETHKHKLIPYKTEKEE